MNEGIVSGKLGLAGWPAVAEEAIIARDVLLAHHVDSRLHICHLSTAGSVEIIQGLRIGERIVVEGTVKLRDSGPVRDLAKDLGGAAPQAAGPRS